MKCNFFNKKSRPCTPANQLRLANSLNQTAGYLLISIMFTVFFWQTGLAQSDGDGGTNALLHEVGASARAFALGRAYVAGANDPSAVFWNPAGLEFVPRMALSLFRTSLVAEGSNYDFIGFVYPSLDFGTIGVGFARVGVDNILKTTISNEVLAANATFDYSEIYISYAKKTFFNITPGVTFKVQRQDFSFGNQVSSSFGLDAGLIYTQDSDSTTGIFKDLSFGFHFQNAIKQQLKPGENDDTLSTRMTLGIMKGFSVGSSGKFRILLDYAKQEFEGGAIHAGAEYEFNKMATLRVGFDDGSPSFGAGIRYNILQIDYAFGNLSYQSEFASTHRFSLSFNLGSSRRDKRLSAIEKRRQREQQLVEKTKEMERVGRVQKHLISGKQFLADNHYFDAYAEFQQVITNDPFNKEAKALFDSSQSLIQQQFAKRQTEAVSQAVDKAGEESALENQRYIKLHFEQGKLFLNKKQYTDALIEFTIALEHAGDDPIIEEAINTTNRRLTNEVKQLVVEARKEYSQGNFSNALRLVGEALVLSPESEELQNELSILENRIKLQQFTIRGLAYLELGKSQQALKEFEQALKLDPTSKAIKDYYNRAKMKSGARRKKMQAEDERKYLEATEHFLGGRYQKALEIYKKLVEKYPRNKKVQDAVQRAEDRLERIKQNR